MSENNQPVTILLTGAGGNLTQFIYRALLKCTFPKRIIACDYGHNAIGLYQADAAYVVPGVAQPNYLERMIEICQRERVNLVIAGGELETRVLAQHRTRFEGQTGALLIASDFEALQRMGDKFELTRMLAEAGFDFPDSILPVDAEAIAIFIEKHGFPLVLKDRFGSGSQGVAVVRSADDLEFQLKRIKNPDLQEYLRPDDQEYTAGVFADSTGTVCASIVMRRELGLGMTAKAETLPFGELNIFCERLVGAFPCRGPINVQFRLTERGPIVFEINPRFSSTTLSRTHFGYNDADMVVRHFFYGKAIPRPTLSTGHLYRFIDDFVVSNADVEAMRQQGRRPVTTD
ncbi:MAG: ATP-grasp domain-containing protein [Cytophagaceae bacterium]|nr:ATP-grasp domain-containing protein [Cytophagaceae bacterium]